MRRLRPVADATRRIAEASARLAGSAEPEKKAARSRQAARLKDSMVIISIISIVSSERTYPVRQRAARRADGEDGSDV